VPSLFVNLFSLKKAMKKGFKVSNDGVVISLNYKQVKLTFDCVIHATDGCVTGVLMKPILNNYINEFANASISTKEVMISIICISYLKITVKKYSTIQFKCMGFNHKLFRYCGQEILNNTINMYGFKSANSFDTCEQCAIAKSRQKNVNKNWLVSSNLPGEHLYVDSSSFKKEVLVEKSSGI
jgi:hypothetical protein